MLRTLPGGSPFRSASFRIDAAARLTSAAGYSFQMGSSFPLRRRPTGFPGASLHWLASVSRRQTNWPTISLLPRQDLHFGKDLKGSTATAPAAGAATAVWAVFMIIARNV